LISATLRLVLDFVEAALAGFAVDGAGLSEVYEDGPEASLLEEGIVAIL